MTKHRTALPLAFVIALGAAQAAPTIEGCPRLPADNVWNARVDTLPVHPQSAQWILNAARDTSLVPNGNVRAFHMDFGSGTFNGQPIGIPYISVAGNQARVPVAFDEPDESDPSPYPIPPNAPIEGGPASSGDRHVLVIDRDNCYLYETGVSVPVNGGASWTAFSGAKFNLRSNALRPSTWTSADAAGLPIFPGLVHYDEAASGTIAHALRVTVPRTRNAFVWPARHQASSVTDPNVPPMGARYRLKASVNIAGLPPVARAIAQAMKTYGLILADNGSTWYVSGTQDERWDNDVLHTLDFLRGSDLEVVDTSSLLVDPNSGRVPFVVACPAGDTDGDGIPDCVEAQQALNAAAKDNNVFANGHLFAMQQFRDFLSREGDSGGIDFWSEQLERGALARGQVVESFFNSAEFQGVIAPVARLYFAYFLRIPDYAGLDFWITQYRAGTTLAAISQAFATSPEFTGRYGALNNTQFVTLVYQNVLARAPDAAGLAFWVGQLNGGMTRGAMMIGFSESAEYRAAIANEVYVTMMYTGMLRRSPDAGGFAFWVGHLDGGNSGLTLINGFLGTPEYRLRFLP